MVKKSKPQYLVWGKNKSNIIGGVVCITKKVALKKKKLYEKKLPECRFYIRKYD